MTFAFDTDVNSLEVNGAGIASHTLTHIYAVLPLTKKYFYKKNKQKKHVHAGFPYNWSPNRSLLCPDELQMDTAQLKPLLGLTITHEQTLQL